MEESRREFVEDEDTATVPEAEEYDRFFSASSPLDPRSRGRQGETSRLQVPSNISINAKYLFLSGDKITASDATKLLDQCQIPGFVNSIQSNHILILKKANYLIDIRVMSQQDDWETLFPTLQYDDVPHWMDRLAVLEAANLVYALFGAESTAQQSITQETVDLLLRKVPFNIDFTDESVEDVRWIYHARWIIQSVLPELCDS